MSSTPDKQKPWLVVSAAPKVGSGNGTEATIVAHNLQAAVSAQPDFSPKLIVEPAKVFDSGLTQLAQLKHSSLSHSASNSITYAERNATERNSLPATALKIDMATNLMNEVNRLLKKHDLQKKSKPEKPQVALISPQDMAMEGLIKYGFSNHITLALFLICPDVFGKFDPQKTEINEKMVHLFWNLEAYEKALKTLPPEKVKLIIPPDPLEAFPDKPTKPLAEGDKPLIKLSGSGGDPVITNAIAARLTEIGLTPTVVCETSEKLEPYAEKNVATESDPSWYYHSLGAANPKLPPYLICYPSEQVKHLVALQQKGIFIPTVFLYPKGLHEARNLAWAIKQGISKVICVPKTLPESRNPIAATRKLIQRATHTETPPLDPQAEVAKLLAAEGVDASLYTMVDPSELTKEHFQKPTQAWERPPAAQSLFDTVRGVLTGNSVVKTS